MRSLTVDECSVVSGGLLQKPFGDIGAFDDGSSFGSILGPLAFLLEKQGGSGGDSGGSGVFVTTDANGVETVWVFNSHGAEIGSVASDLKFENCKLLFSSVGAAAGYLAGLGVGEAVGGGLGFLVGVYSGVALGPIGVVFFAGTGAAIGARFGGPVGAGVGGWIGTNAGTVVCPR